MYNVEYELESFCRVHCVTFEWEQLLFDWISTHMMKSLKSMTTQSDNLRYPTYHTKSAIIFVKHTKTGK